MRPVGWSNLHSFHQETVYHSHSNRGARVPAHPSITYLSADSCDDEMNDMVIHHMVISHHFASPDCVFRPHRCQPCFLRGCNSSNRWVSWGLKPITITCINSSFQYSHCGIISWTMDQLTAEPIPNLICRMNHCMAFFAAIRQSVAFFIFRVWGTLAASTAYSWYTIHTPHNQNSCILVIILNENFVSNSSPSDGSITMDRGRGLTVVL